MTALSCPLRTYIVISQPKWAPWERSTNRVQAPDAMRAIYALAGTLGGHKFLSAIPE